MRFVTIAALLSIVILGLCYRAAAPVITPAAPPVTPPPTPNQFLLAAGRQWNVLSIKTGKPHHLLQQAAEAHAAYQARVQVQGHQEWSERVANLQRQLPADYKEVANESWPGQDVKAAANEMYNSWRQSPGHWSAVNGKCTYYGYAMCKSSNGTWYACAIFAILP